MTSIHDAATAGTQLELLEALRDKAAEKLDDPDISARDFVPTSRLLLETLNRIDALKADPEGHEGSEGAQRAEDVPNERFDPEAI